MKTTACRLKRKDEFFALAVVCGIIPNRNSRSELGSGEDAFAIHGRLGAQVALPQSPIPRAVPTASIGAGGLSDHKSAGGAGADLIFLLV